VPRRVRPVPALMDTRTIAIIGAVLAVIVLLIVLL
jgi:hypothetical protein